MRKNQCRDSSRSATSAIDSQTIPDPWELTPPKAQVKPSQVPQVWQVPVEKHPLISPSGNPDALCLGSPKTNSKQVLLRDWLKLGSQEANSLAIQWCEALGLLYWIEETTG